MSGQEWRLQASCRGLPLRVSARAFAGATSQAGFIADFCRRCPVTQDCLDYAVQVDSHGVFGGTTRRERVKAGLVPKAAECRWTERRWKKPAA